jgi:hypothetical protein
MYKPVLRKETNERGIVTLTFNDGQVDSQIRFIDESVFQGFVFALRCLVSSGADSVGCMIPVESNRAAGTIKFQEYEEEK